MSHTAASGSGCLIIDACEAGQTLDKVDPRAGPLAGRSLAQLAYDKAIFVINASQSQQAARELPHLGHGVFSYVLFEKALGPAADEKPRWSDLDPRMVGFRSGRDAETTR